MNLFALCSFDKIMVMSVGKKVIPGRKHNLGGFEYAPLGIDPDITVNEMEKKFQSHRVTCEAEPIKED